VRKVLSGKLYISEKMVSEVLEKMSSGTSAMLRPKPVDCLSDRELTVLEMIGSGHSSRAIADSLKLGVATVDTYRARIKEKLRLRNAAELYSRAAQWVHETGA